MQSTRNQILGWGFDARRENRPGVPAERTPPQPIGSPTWTEPERQIGEPSVSTPLRRVTPVFGTAVPLRGLSGVVRRLAYELPDYKPRRWMLLMLADRIDVLEHNLRPIALTLGVVGLGFFGWRALRR